MQPGKIQLVLVILIGTLLLVVLCALIIIFLFLFKSKQRRNLEETAALRTVYEQEILRSQVEVQNQTMQHIGQDLHDNIGQLLTVIRLNLNILEESLPDGELLQRIVNTNQIASQTITEIRALTKSLDGDFVQEFGLVNGLTHELNRLQKMLRYTTRLNVGGEPYPLGFQQEIVLFRVVQELISNTIRHARADRIEIQLNFLPQVLDLTMTDNGNGFDYEAVVQRSSAQTGSGLRNIQRRIRLIGGTCTFQTAPGSGTTVVIQLPVEDRKL